MNIVMSGATGFVGTHLRKAFEGRGWKVTALGRDDFSLDDGSFRRKIEGADVVIHLAGATIISRWTEEYKKTIYSSRVDTARKIVRALNSSAKKPELFISTSAVGIYATKGSHTEESTHYANNFLGSVALHWEAAALEAGGAGVRTIIFRYGIVLGPNGGAFAKMLVPFRLGLGGVIGDGQQAVSWIHISDLTKAYMSAIDDRSFMGIYNLTAPHPTTNEGLTKALGRALSRPTVMRVPTFVLKLQLGEAAQVLTEGQTVLPKRLIERGFPFQFQNIEEAVREILSHA